MKTIKSIATFTAALDRALESSTHVLPQIQETGVTGHVLLLVANGNPTLKLKVSSATVALKVRRLLLRRIDFFAYRHIEQFTMRKPFVKQHNHRQYSKSALKEIADTILKDQVTRNTWMCIGMRNPIYLFDSRYQMGGLQVSVTIDHGKKNVLFIRLNWNDTYRLEVWQVRAGQYKLEEYLDEVYCDQLDEAIYWLCTPHGRDKAWAESIKAGTITFDDWITTTLDGDAYSQK